MKMWLLQALLAAIPFYLTSGTAGASEIDGEVETKVVIVKCVGDGDNVNCVHSGDGDADGVKIIIKTCVDGDDPADCCSGLASGNVFAFAGDDADGLKWISDGEGEGHAIVIANGDGEDTKRKIHVFKRRLAGSKKGAFLGVNLISLSSDDADEVDGVRISGVIDDGPAAKAGLEAGDVIIAIGGDSVASGMNALTKALRARESGDQVDVVVLRDGDEETFSVTLGSRGSIAISFALGAGGVGEIEDSVKARGHIVIKNDDGDWEVKDLGNLAALKDLPLNIKMFMPKLGSRSIAISTDGGEKVISISKSTYGKTLAIERRGDGEITVTRIDEDGEETVDTYASEDELQKSDEEAYDFLQDSTGNITAFDFQGIGDEDGMFDINFDLDTDDLHENIFLWRSELDDTLGEAREAYERAMEELGTLKEELHDEHREKFDRLHFLFQQGSDGKNFKFPGMARFEAFGKPRHAFEVRSDGTIEVKIRKGDSELVQLFDDADDLENRDPKLYKKYRKLMDQDE